MKQSIRLTAEAFELYAAIAKLLPRSMDFSLQGKWLPLPLLDEFERYHPTDISPTFLGGDRCKISAR